MYLKANQVSPAEHAALQADVTFASKEGALEEGWARNQADQEEANIAHERAVERRFAQWLAFPGDR